MKNTKLCLITIICLTLCWALIPINQAMAETTTETIGVSGSPNSTYGCNSYTTTESTTVDGTEVMLVEYDSWGNLVAQYPAEDNLPSSILHNEGNCSGELYRTDTTYGDWSLVDTYTIGTGECKTYDSSCYMSTDQTYTGHNTYYFTYSNFDLVCQDVGYPNIPSSYYFNNDGCIGTLSLRETNEGSETFAGQGSDVYINGELCMTIYTTFDVCASYTGQVFKNKQECRNNYREIYERSCTAAYSGDISCESCWTGQMD